MVSKEALELLEAAERVEAAADLEAGLPARAAELAAAVTELCAGDGAGRLSPRGLWNLLWLAGDLTGHVDVYRARALLSTVEGLFERHFARAVTGPAASCELAEVAEMAFDFFFNRPTGEQPLLWSGLDETLASLERVLRIENPVCQRASLHGLAHVREQLDGTARDRVDALFDDFLRRTPDVALAQYAARARAGELP
jgi:hypothetical protein